MEYLTLLNYLYTISSNYRKRMLKEMNLRSIAHRNEAQKAHQEGAFFLHNHLTLLDKLFTLKHHKSAH